MSASTLDLPERPTATDALQAHGLNGDRVLKLARHIANDAAARSPYMSHDVREDLVSFLTLQALEAVRRYDPTRSGNGYTLTSYLCDVMEARVPDFFRRKSEGFGDRRYGNDGRLDLAGDDTDAFDAEVDMDAKLRDRRVALWHQAADLDDMTFADWVAYALDFMAKRRLKAAA